MSWRWLAAALLLAGCQSPPELAPDAGGGFEVEADGVSFARFESHPGGGVELTVRLEDADGRPLTTDESANLSLRWLDEQTPRATAVRRAAMTEPGYTLVLVMPAADAQTHADRIEAVRAFVLARPAGERVAIYRWLDSIEQVANYDDDRERVLRVLDRLPARDGAATLTPSTVALRDVVGSVSAVGGEAPRGLRAAVIVADQLPGPVPDGAGHAVPVVWVVPDATVEQTAALGAGRVVATLDAAAEALAELASEAFYDLAVCGAGAAARAAVVSLSDDRGELTLVVPPWLAESSQQACDAGAILEEPRAYPDRLELVFTPEQRAIHDERLAAFSKADFDLSVRFGADELPVEATAHLRGKGSIGCERRNYTLNFKGPRPRYVTPGSATDELYLISMCLDDRYVRTHTAYSLYAEHGLFPVEFRYVELVLDGQSRGIYLVIEKVAEELVRDNGRVRSVMRRRYDAGSDATYADVKFTYSTVEDAVAVFAAQSAGMAELAGADLEAALEDRIDLDRYLRMMAMNSLLHNGDNVDEVWLMSSERMRADGAVGDWVTYMAWDPDDIFADCHYNGDRAYPDELGLSYCAEGEIDDLVLGDPVLYGRYIETLEALMAAIPPERFRAQLDVTRDGLLAYLRRPEISSAMLELLADNPAAADPTVAEAEVVAALDALQAAFELRYEELLSRLPATARRRTSTSPAAAPRRSSW